MAADATVFRLGVLPNQEEELDLGPITSRSQSRLILSSEVLCQLYRLLLYTFRLAAPSQKFYCLPCLKHVKIEVFANQSIFPASRCDEGGKQASLVRFLVFVSPPRLTPAFPVVAQRRNEYSRNVLSRLSPTLASPDSARCARSERFIPFRAQCGTRSGSFHAR